MDVSAGSDIEHDMCTVVWKNHKISLIKHNCWTTSIWRENVESKGFILRVRCQVAQVSGTVLVSGTYPRTYSRHYEVLVLYSLWYTHKKKKGRWGESTKVRSRSRSIENYTSNFLQHPPKGFPIDGVGYMDQTKPLCSVFNGFISPLVFFVDIYL